MVDSKQKMWYVTRPPDERKYDMGSWGANSGLEGVVAQFPPKLKQAIYSAANKGPIARRTWNHCALNAAGKEEDVVVNSTLSAAAAFGISDELASKFIGIWDQRTGTDEEATEYLKECILQAGLFSEPQTSGKRIVTITVYKAEVEAFEVLEEAGLIENVDDAKILLGV